MKRTERPTTGGGDDDAFRLFLQAELAGRCAANDQYSLRAFANSLGVDHSSLSQMLRGKRRITTGTITEFCKRLGVDAANTQRFMASANMSTREIPAAAYDAIVQLAQDAAGLLSEWSGYAILELLRLHDFRPDSRWIANVLGISADEVNIALQRLLRLGLLEMADERHWRDRSREGIGTDASRPLATVMRLLEKVRTLSSTVAAKAPTTGPSRNP